MNPLLRGLFDQFRAAEELGSLGEADAFELFAASLTVPTDVLLQTSLMDLLLDPGTPGLDVVTVLVNGHLVRDAAEVDEIAADAAEIRVSVTLLQAKTSSGVDTKELLNFSDVARKFLDLQPFPDYPALDSLSSALSRVFRAYAGKLAASPRATAKFVTTANNASVTDATVEERRKKMLWDLQNLGHLGEVSVEVWGTDELHSAWRKRNTANETEIAFHKAVNLPKMPGVDGAVLGIVPLSELFKMISSGDAIDERIFYDNVRGFQGEANSVNARIMDTVTNGSAALLPILNNGITVVADKFSALPGDAYSLTGYQIVNGCQTSHSLFIAARDANYESASETFVPMRVVATQDESVKSEIILATNSQTQVDESQLVALTNFQKKLEDFYALDSSGVGLHYERRPGQYYGKSIAKARVVSIRDQLRSLSAIALRNPHTAARFPNQLYDVVKDEVFIDGHELLPYVASAYAAYKLEGAFRGGLDRELKMARYHILLAYAVQTIGKPLAPLNSKQAGKDAEAIIERLNSAKLQEHFTVAANAVLGTVGEAVLTRDRFKSRTFTDELLRNIQGKSASGS